MTSIKQQRNVMVMPAGVKLGWQRGDGNVKIGPREGTTKNAKSAKMEERIVNQLFSRVSRIS